MEKFRKKPVVVEAIQLCWRNWDQVCDLGFINPDNAGRLSDECSHPCGERTPFLEVTIPTLEGNMIAMHGDWIVRGIRGELYPVKPDIFIETYEVAS